MDPSARASYQETTVRTATSQRLRLLLIENAIRLARQTQLHWLENRFEPGYQSATRCRDILFELLTTIEKNGSELNRTVAGIYCFLHKTMLEASCARDPAKIDAIIRILEIERDTWQ